MLINGLEGITGVTGHMFKVIIVHRLIAAATITIQRKAIQILIQGKEATKTLTAQQDNLYSAQIKDIEARNTNLYCLNNVRSFT